ncbi:MAG: hypothetical protein IJ716_14005 [Lachnospiraceae bacterium]|nr:hypothetical protein [Lachnospiraceae bacterium]
MKSQSKKNKTERIDIRLTKSELSRLKRYAQKYGMSVSEYILGNVFSTPNYYRQELNFIQTMTALQNYVNDINEGKADPADTAKSQEVIDEIWKKLS